MRELQEHSVHCPYCGETIGVLIDTSVAEQDYVEDCQVCCRPIDFRITVDLDGDVQLRAITDSE